MNKKQLYWIGKSVLLLAGKEILFGDKIPESISDESLKAFMKRKLISDTVPKTVVAQVVQQDDTMLKELTGMVDQLTGDLDVERQTVAQLTEQLAAANETIAQLTEQIMSVKK